MTMKNLIFLVLFFAACAEVYGLVIRKTRESSDEFKYKQIPSSIIRDYKVAEKISEKQDVSKVLHERSKRQLREEEDDISNSLLESRAQMETIDYVLMNNDIQQLTSDTNSTDKSNSGKRKSPKENSGKFIPKKPRVSYEVDNEAAGPSGLQTSFSSWQQNRDIDMDSLSSDSEEEKNLDPNNNIPSPTETSTPLSHEYGYISLRDGNRRERLDEALRQCSDDELLRLEQSLQSLLSQMSFFD